MYVACVDSQDGVTGKTQEVHVVGQTLGRQVRQ